MRTTFWFNDNDDAVRTVNSVYTPDAILYDGKLKISNNGVPLHAPADTIIYDSVSKNFYAGQGNTKHPIRVSDVLVFKDTDSMPTIGVANILYVALKEKQCAVWDDENKSYCYLSVGSEGSVFEKAVEEYPAIENFPLVGSKNKIYLTRTGKGYRYNTAEKKYEVLFRDTDSYSKQESDDRYLKKSDAISNKDTNNFVTKDEFTPVKDAIFGTNGLANFYYKSEIDEKLAKIQTGGASLDGYAKISDLDDKADADQVYTKVEIDQKLSNISSGSSGGSAIDIAYKKKIDDLEAELIEYKKRLADVANFAADDYEDTFEISVGETKTVFNLTHKPIGKIRFYIDGVRYFSDYFQYNKENNTVTWIGTESNMGSDKGFDVTDSMVVIEYDYIKES